MSLSMTSDTKYVAYVICVVIPFEHSASVCSSEIKTIKYIHKSALALVIMLGHLLIKQNNNYKQANL